MAYGAKDPLTVLGAFDAEVIVGSDSKLATFYVIEHGSRNLLGKDTAVSLNVLKLGIPVNAVAMTIFPKFKGGV